MPNFSQRRLRIDVQGPGAQEWLERHAPDTDRREAEIGGWQFSWTVYVVRFRLPEAPITLGLEWQVPSYRLIEEGLRYFRTRVPDGANLLNAHAGLLICEVEQP